MPGAASSRAEIEPARREELPRLSALCMRSKAHWGYDAEFMASCRDELTLREADLRDSDLGVIRDAAGPLALAQVSVDGTEAEIDKLFVDPRAMGQGLGRCLFDWIVETARARGATTLRIEADPDACAFYERMGARLAGTAPSGSIPGRVLPLLQFALKGPE